MRSLVLLFAQPCSVVGIHIVIVIRSNLHEIERYLTQTKLAAPLVHKNLHALRILVAGVAHVRAALVVDDSPDGVVQYGVERAVAPEHGAVVVPFGLEGHDAGRVGGFLGVFLQVLLGQPALHTGSALVGHDESDGNVERLVEHLCEEIACGRGLANGLRRPLFPFCRL